PPLNSLRHPNYRKHSLPFLPLYMAQPLIYGSASLLSSPFLPCHRNLPSRVDIVLQASGTRVLCHGTCNSRTSPFSLPLAHLPNVSRLQRSPSVTMVSHCSIT